MKKLNAIGVAAVVLGGASFLLAAWHRLDHGYDLFFEVWALIAVLLIMTGATLVARQISLEAGEGSGKTKLLTLLIAIGWASVLVALFCILS